MTRNANLPICPPWNANLPIRRPPRLSNPSKPHPTDHLTTPPSPSLSQSPTPLGAPKGWTHRGYLPHFDGPNTTQFVTLHLADSLPKEVVEQMKRQLESIPPEEQPRELRRKIEAYIDAGHGSCLLRDPEIAQMVQDSFLHFHTQRYLLYAWVIMPNHFHILFKPINQWSLRKVVASWKKHTARKILDAQRNPDRKSPDLPSSNKHKSPDSPSSPVWHPEFWDRFIRDDQHFRRALDYIHQNPVKAGLSPRPQDWPWSTANPAVGTQIS